jgi:hypothetical protein
MSKFSKHKWWILTIVLTMPIMAWGAIANFQSGTTISATTFNTLLNGLDNRITNLENKAVPTINCILQPGASSAPWAATCPAGYARTGGGCATNASTNPNAIVQTANPVGTNQWTCGINAGSFPNDGSAYTYAICCKLN